MAKKYQLTQFGVEVQALLDKVEGLKANQTPEQGATPTALETLALEGVLYSVVTKAVSDLVNYYTKNETYTKSEVNAMVAAIKQFTIQSVDSLPPPSAETMNILYLVPAEEPKSENEKDEFITVIKEGSYDWEQVGSTAIDLSGYVTTEALNTVLAGYVTSRALEAALEGLHEVKYAKQSLTDEQKAQARENIGAVDEGTVQQLDGRITDLEEGAEKNTNKVQTLTGNESDQTKYPSAKAVADAIVAGKQIFWATFGETTATDVAAKLAAGIVVLCLRSNIVYSVTSLSSGNFITFGAIYGGSSYYLLLNKSDDTWQAGSNTLENTSNKTGDIEGNKTSTTKYPTVKAVADALAGKQNTIDSEHKLDYSLLSNTPTIPTVEPMTAAEVSEAVNNAWNTVINA